MTSANPSAGSAPAAPDQLPRPRAADGQAPPIVPWQRRFLGSLHVTGAFWHRYHAFSLTWAPDWLLQLVTVPVCSGFALALFGMRRAISNNLEWALDRRLSWWQRLRLSLQTIVNHAWCMTETWEALTGRPNVQVETEGAEHWQAVTESDSGFIVVTAHVGHWDIGSRIGESDRPATINIVREPEVDPEGQQFLIDLLRAASAKSTSALEVAVHFTRVDDPTLGPRLLSALRRGEIVALQGDRPRSGGKSVPVELFGKEIDLPIGPVALARAARVPILPIFVFRTGRRACRVVFQRPIAVARSKEREVDHTEAMQEIVDGIEWAIREEPTQWFCFRDLWGRRPD